MGSPVNNVERKQKRRQQRAAWIGTAAILVMPMMLVCLELQDKPQKQSQQRQYARSEVKAETVEASAGDSSGTYGLTSANRSEGTTTAYAVPEPASLAIFLPALVMLRRRRG